jgi:Protein of unknown function (DUF1997)
MDTQFTASQSVSILVPNQPVPIRHYLRQPRRLVYALAASSQIEQLDDRFRLKMRPLNFMTLSIQPTVDMRVWATADGVLHIQSIACEIRGVEYINQRFSLNLLGMLYPTAIAGKTYLKGQADLAVQVELPPPFMFTPKALLEKAGNGLLLSVLTTMKQRLTHQLLLDYQQWVTAEAETQPVGQIAPVG